MKYDVLVCNFILTSQLPRMMSVKDIPVENLFFCLELTCRAVKLCHKTVLHMHSK
jgi:hypothetical protein